MFTRDSLPAVVVQLKIHYVGNFCMKSLIFLFTVSITSFRNYNYLFRLLPFESGCCHNLVADPVVTNCEEYECPPPTTAHCMTLRVRPAYVLNLV
jgi:hypothetical protein